MAETEKNKEFGEIALKKGYISREELEEALKIQKKEAEGRKSPPQLGEILVERGYLTREEVDAVARSQARQSKRNKIPGYKLIKKLGEGATGAVYKARKEDSGQAVAIKVLFPSIQKDKQFLKRFFREARTVSRLHHENIIQGIDVGEHEELYYFVMEYIDGRTLLDILNEQGPFSEKRVIEIGRQITRALAHAHEHGLVHRDIKPENIMLNRDDVIKLCDLGLAKKTQDEAKSVTRTGASVGTPYYMSPEQASGEDDIDIRTDLYSLGATMYRLLTDRVPFDGKTSAEIMTKHLTEDLVPPREIKSTIRPSMDRVIQKMMQKDRDERYQDPEQLIDDLNRIAAGREPVHALDGSPDGYPGEETWEIGGIRTLRTRITRFLTRLRENWSPLYTVRSILLGTLGLTLLVAVLYFTSGDTTTSAGGSGVATPSGPSSPPSSTPKNSTDPSGNQSGGGSGSNSVPGDQKGEAENPDSSPDRQTRKWFHELKTSVNQFDGDLDDVNDLSKEISTFKSKQPPTDRLWHRAKKLRDRFLSEQAQRYFQETVRPQIEKARRKNDLDRAYVLLDDFPNLFMNTDTWTTIEKKKKKLKKEIESTCRDKYKTVRTLLNHEKFTRARRILDRVKPMLSSNLTPGLLKTHKKLTKKIRAQREKKFSEQFSRSMEKFLSFHGRFKKKIPLHKKSIFTIDLQPLRDLIDTHRKNIPLESFRNRIDGYRKDVRLLKYYRELLSKGIKNAIRNNVTLQLDNPGRSSGPITERTGDKLTVQIEKQATSSTTVSSLSLGRRLEFAGAKTRKHTTQQKLAYGLAAYYADARETAMTWLKKAGKDGDDRAVFYVNRMKHDPSHRKVSLIMKELNRIVQQKQKFQADVVLDIATEYWKSDAYEKDVIRKAQSLVNEDSLFNGEKSK